MFWRKFFRRGLISCLIAIFLLSAAIVGAKIQMYTATGEDYANEIESQDIAKLRALDKAIKKATKQAGVYLKTYSRSVDSELTDDEVLAITSNAWELVSEPKYSSKIVKGSDETSIIIWTATVEVNVDDSEIQSWIKRDDNDKSTIITQTREAQKASEENDRKIEDLREKYNRATSQAEKDSIRKQMTDADRDFLANQKLKEGLRLYYDNCYDDAIKLYNEAIKLKPNYAEAYYNRGEAYYFIDKYNRAIKDFNKAIELRPDYADAYCGRGHCYYMLDKSEQSLKDYNKAIELNTNEPSYYNARVIVYKDLKKYEQAKSDYNKMIELEPNAHHYNSRAIFYEFLDDYYSAILDYTKALELNPKDELSYKWRAKCYQKLNLKNKNKIIQYFTNEIELEPKAIYYSSRAEFYEKINNYDAAIQDYNKAIELEPNIRDYISRAGIYEKTNNYDVAVQDYNKVIELEPNYARSYFRLGYIYEKLKNYNMAVDYFTKVIELESKYIYAYYMRGKCYQALGEDTKAQADFAKYNQLRKS